jgi:hypothetical protein
MTSLLPNTFTATTSVVAFQLRRQNKITLQLTSTLSTHATPTTQHPFLQRSHSATPSKSAQLSCNTTALTQTPATMSTLDLSNELIDRIVDFIVPETHLSFALACKRHLACSQRMLAYHRECSVKHREITDLSRYWSSPGDPVATYHNHDLVAYHAHSIVKALQIRTLRSLEIRRFQPNISIGGFNSNVLSINFKSSIKELCLRNVRMVSE